MKKGISLFAVVVMITCLFAGCGKSGDTKPKEGTETGQNENWEPETATKPAPKCTEDHDHSHDGHDHK